MTGWRPPSADDLIAWAEADERFHQGLAEHTGNGRLARMFGTIMDQSHRARMLTLRLRPCPACPSRTMPASSRRRRRRCRRRPGPRPGHRDRARDQILPLLEQHGMRQL